MTFKKIILTASISVFLTLLVSHVIQLQNTRVVIREVAVPSFVNNNRVALNPAQSAGWESTAPLNFTNAASVATRSVVSIHAHEGDEFSLFGRDRYERSSGSGVIIDREGYLVTNRHVIEDMSQIEVTLFDKSVYPAMVLGIDAATDLAVLKIEGVNFDFLPFGDSDNTEIGEWVLAVGNPFSLNSTVTAGIVSAKGRSINILDDPGAIESFIQTDAAVNAGNSGGALVNTKGELVGINTAILTKSGRYEGYSFAVPSKLVEKISGDIIDYGAVQRAFLGVGIEEMSLKKATQLGLDHAHGILITHVESGSAADDAGLLPGDVLLEINDRPVNEIAMLKERIALKSPGDEVELSLLRENEKMRKKAILKNVNKDTGFIFAPRNILLSEIGVELRDFSMQEKEALQMSGALISKILEDGMASSAGLKKNFLIEFCNDQRVLNSNQLFNLFETIQGDLVLQGRYLEEDRKREFVLVR